MQLGYPHPDMLLEQLTAKQFNDWIDYNGIEPFGEIRAEQRNGLACSLLANVNRDPKVKVDPFVPENFMFHVRKAPERKLTDEEVEKHLDSILR